MKKIRVLLVGSPAFAIPSFESVLDAPQFEVVGLITKPSKPVGRKQELRDTPAKLWAESRNLRVHEPHSLKNEDAVSLIRNVAPDVILVIAYGKLIPASILSIPKFGVINVHPSFLPKLRGPSPIQYAILNGEKETGVSIMLLDSEIDHGSILYQEKMTLRGDETTETLTGRLAQLAARSIPKTLSAYIQGEIAPTAQKHGAVTFSKLILTEDGLLDFKKSARELDRIVRALSDEPGAFFMHKGKRIKVRHSEILNTRGKVGEFFLHKNKLGIFCKSDALLIDEVQPEGKQWMKSKNFFNGLSPLP